MRRRMLLLVMVLVAGLAGLAGWWTSAGTPAVSLKERTSGLALVRPALAQERSFLEAEAGPSAWMKVEPIIDLDRAARAIRAVEQRTRDYVVGSVPVPEYGEGEDVHAFVHKDGWLIVYYFPDSPWARTVHWDGPVYAGNKLELALREIVSNLGVASGAITYYDFRHPSAEEVLIALDGSQMGDGTFSITMPQEFVIFERSYSFTGRMCSGYWCRSGTNLTLDESRLPGSFDESGGWVYGTLSASQLSQGIEHAVSVHVDNSNAGGFGSAAVVVLYRSP